MKLSRNLVAVGLYFIGNAAAQDVADSPAVVDDAVVPIEEHDGTNATLLEDLDDATTNLVFKLEV